MTLLGQNETIDNLDEAKVLGYFETIRGVFITKMAFLLHFVDDTLHLLPAKLLPDVIDALKAEVPHDLSYDAIQAGNQEIVANYVEDTVTVAVLSSWNVFEQLIKDIPSPGYSHFADDIAANYGRGLFALSADEKRNLDLFYYIRNAIVHYNGAYYAYREIDRHYRGQHFRSVGHHGEKIEIGLQRAWQIIEDIQVYALKAWGNWHAHKAAAAAASAVAAGAAGGVVGPPPPLLP